MAAMEGTTGQTTGLAVLDSLRDAFAVLDRAGCIVQVNAAWRRLALAHGGDAGLVRGIGIDYLAALRRSAAQDSDAAAALQGIEAVLAGLQPLFELAYACYLPPAPEAWYELSVVPMADASGGVLVGHREITAQHRADHDLKALLNSASSMIGYWDRDLRNRFANHAYRNWFGLAPEEIPGRHIREVIGEERYRLNLPYIERALAGEMQVFERDIPGTDGQMRHSLARYVPDILAGEVRGFYVEVVDVTPVKRSERALQRAQEVGRLGSFVLDLLGGQWEFSPMMLRLLGCAAPLAAGIDGLSAVLHAADRAATLDDLHQCAGKGPLFDRHFRIVRADDGEVRWLHGLGEVECSSAGVPLRLVGTVQDISERKVAEVATAALLGENTRLLRQLITLQESERKTLAGELHDELSQHLTAIRAFAGAIRRSDGPVSPGVEQAARAIEDSARDIYNVSHRLMEGLHPMALEQAGIEEALRHLLDTWSTQHPEIEWRAMLAPDLVCEGGKLRLAVYRLVQECLSNVARHAAARRLRIVLAPRQLPGEGRWLRLLVRDDGVGMDLTQPTAGFGLLGMRERVLGLGGKFSLCSRPGAGTRIRVLLPAG